MPRLEDLANELFDAVVSFLSVKDLRSLRLVSRAISYKAIERSFSGVRLNLTLANLKSFEHATSTFLGRCIKDLTLVGLVSDYSPLKEVLKSGKTHRYPREPDVEPVACTEEELVQVQTDLDLLNQWMAEWRSAVEESDVAVTLLTQAFDHIAKKSPRKCLERLSLEVKIFHDPHKPPTMVRDLPKEPRPAPESVRRTLRRLPGDLDSAHEGARRTALKITAVTSTLAMRSLRRSGLKLHALDMYTSAPTSYCCSIPIDMLAADLRDDPDTPPLPFGDIRKLSISFTDPLSLSRSNEEDSAAAAHQAHLINSGFAFGLTKLLQLCPNVEELHIGRGRPPPSSLPSQMRMWCTSVLLQQQIQSLTTYVRLPRLRKLRVGGFRTKDIDLAGLFRVFQDSLQYVELIGLSIDGTLSNALAPFSDGTCKLDSLALENLQETGRDNVGESRPAYLRRGPKPIWADRDRDQPYLVISRPERWKSRWCVIRRYGEEARRPVAYRTDSHFESSNEMECYGSERYDEYYCDQYRPCRHPGRSRE